MNSKTVHLWRNILSRGGKRMTKVSDAELEILKVIWDKEEVTSSVIIKEVEKFHWSDNTVRTLIRRLQAKGAIKAIETDGKAFLYRPIFKKEKYRKEVIEKLLEQLYHNSVSELIWQFCEVGDVKVQELERMITYIEEKEKKLK